MATTVRCWDLVRDSSKAQQRIERACKHIHTLGKYRTLLNSLSSLSIDRGDDCRRLRPLIVERAFEAEASTRLAIADALDGINELRDAGEWYDRVAAGMASIVPFTPERAPELLGKMGESFKVQLGVDSASFVDEAATAIKALDLTIDKNDRGILMSYMSPFGGRTSRLIGLSPQVGQSGRVSTAEFFGHSARGSFETFAATYVSQDCHSRTLRPPLEKLISIDSYGGLIAGMAALKAQAYQHARRIEELGPRALRGSDPVTAVGIVIGVIGLGVLIYGLATQDYGVAAFGAVLMLGGGLVAFAGWTLIIGVLV